MFESDDDDSAVAAVSVALVFILRIMITTLGAGVCTFLSTLPHPLIKLVASRAREKNGGVDFEEQENWWQWQHALNSFLLYSLSPPCLARLLLIRGGGIWDNVTHSHTSNKTTTVLLAAAGCCTTQHTAKRRRGLL
jgi:hypothetical protein